MLSDEAAVLDLFCGAGGLAKGFKEVGFNITGVDLSEKAGKTFEMNIKSEFIEADLSKELVDGDFNIIIGGPSCKPWSSVNLTRRGKKHLDYNLLSRFFSHIELHTPEIFLLENVPPLVKDETFKAHIKKLSEEYSIAKDVVVYSDYGAPISRHRLIVFGSKLGDAANFFRKLSLHKKTPKTVRDAIWKLRGKKNGEIPDHIWPNLKTIEKYRHYYETNKFGWYILKWNKPAPSFGNVMKTYILHPDAFNGRPPRVISVKEALLIMGFDASYHFPQGFGLGSRYQMTVDAVSPVFSLAAARTVKEIFCTRA